MGSDVVQKSASSSKHQSRILVSSSMLMIVIQMQKISEVYTIYLDQQTSEFCEVSLA